jgi:hypothetical protein
MPGMKKLQIYFLILCFFIVNSCRKTAAFPSDQLSDYMQLQVGKYITYRLDSLVFINFGTQDSIASYLAKDIVDAAIVDNLGRPGWRVIRYISDTTGTSDWTPSEAYMVIPTRETLEVIENNLRYQKLKLPIENGFNWKGNSYIDTRTTYQNSPGLGSWDFTYLDNWDYTYDSVGNPFTVLSGTVPKTITVHQANDSTGTPSNIVDTLISSRTFSEEVYGKGIGLIYKNFLYWQYQPPNIGTPVGSTTGYGIKLNMIDHN